MELNELNNQGRRMDQYEYSFMVSSISFILLLIVWLYNIII
jgi:hypothetical protein